MFRSGRACASRVRALLPLAAIAVLAAACSEGGNYPQTTFRPVSEYGEKLNAVFYNTTAWTVGIMFLVFGLLAYIVWRFRERPNQPPPKQIHGNTKLEILWTTIPAIIIVIIAVPTILTIFDTQREAPDEALTIEVIGHQWWWEFRYPEEGIVAANQFYVPVDRPVELRMHSADVIHSFWIPRIGGKRDVNPQPAPAEGQGRHTNQILFTVHEEGVYLGQCAEFCGMSHGIMRMVAHAVAPEAFDAWVEDMRSGATAADRTVRLARTTPATLPVGDTTGTVTQFADSAPPRVQPQASPALPQDVATADVQAATPAQPQPGAIPPPTGLGPQRPPVPAFMVPGAKTDAELGRDVFMTKACVACHAIAGTPAQGALGPVLTRFGARPWVGAGAARNTIDNVQQWIRDPQSVKAGTLMPGATTPGGGMPPTNLTDEEIRLVATYLMSLK
jgi:cytochrome c oxidase subunit 2